VLKRIKFLLHIVLVIFLTGLVAYSHLSLSTALAQEEGVGEGETIYTNPKERTSIITAFVPDIIPPSTPILIAPENNSLLNISKPSFVWYYSTDNVAMSHYRLTMDGEVLFDQIPLVNTDNEFYSLTYNELTNNYTLIPKSNLTDGNHTWKITAVDTSDNEADSVTWSFTIDTQAPAFVITQIGNVETSISAHDDSTIPGDPIELDANEPLLKGTGEANSQVVLTVIIPDQPNQVHNFTIGSDGTWSLQLGFLPRDKVIILDFIITDLAGNVSTLSDVKIIIPQEYFIFPPPPPTPSPSPSVQPSPIPGVTPPPTPPEEPPPPHKPIIKIPIAPPREIIHDFIGILPMPVAEIIRSLPETFRDALTTPLSQLAPIGSLVVTIALPGLGLLVLLWEFARQFSLRFLIKLLQAIGLLPAGEPQGLVYNSETGQPIAFALLTFRSAIYETSAASETYNVDGLNVADDPSAEDLVTPNPIWETAVTNPEGVYQGIQLPSGKYVLEVSHQDYRFPTQKRRPSYLSFRDFYAGEAFETSQNSSDLLFLVPMDPLASSSSPRSWHHSLKIWLSRTRFRDMLIPLFLVSLVITIFYPTLINILILASYLFVMTWRRLKSYRKPPLAGTVKDRYETPIANAVIRITNQESGQLSTLVTTDENGRFVANLKPDLYQLNLVKNGYTWADEGQVIQLQELVLTGQPLEITLYMREAVPYIN
jgi:hypothetical protein